MESLNAIVCAFLGDSSKTLINAGKGEDFADEYMYLTTEFEKILDESGKGRWFNL